MAPKGKEVSPKKQAPNIIRQPISDSSLMYVAHDAVEGFQERLEKCVQWTTLEEGANHHKLKCKRDDIPKRTFSEALHDKIQRSYLRGFLDDNSRMTLDQHWEVTLPLLLWDNEKCATEEGQVCFKSDNCITDNVMDLLKKVVRAGDKDNLRRNLKSVRVLRVTNSKMTELDESLKAYHKLITLNLCGNYLRDIEQSYFPKHLKILELQANAVTKVERFISHLPPNLLYLGLSRNLLTNEGLEGLGQMHHRLTVLDLSDNDIYDLQPILVALGSVPSITSLSLAGNPCSVSMGYARTTIAMLPRLRWLDNREILRTDRPLDYFEYHPEDLRSSYFYFNVIRIMSVPQPPKVEKTSNQIEAYRVGPHWEMNLRPIWSYKAIGITKYYGRDIVLNRVITRGVVGFGEALGQNSYFHVELELPLLDSQRRQWLMFRSNNSLAEMLPAPEDDEWPPLESEESKVVVEGEALSHESDVYAHLVPKNPLEVIHYTKFESNKVPWNKVMTFQEPTVKIFCPDLTALRNTFRSVVTVRLVYTLITTTVKPVGKPEKKSATGMKAAASIPPEQNLILASIKCPLRRTDWSQPAQHFHWDETMDTSEAVHWGDGDLAVLQYINITGPVKPVKGGKDEPSMKQQIPENFTCHFGFGIERLSS